MPKISIIVPIYNVEPYLDRCLSSLRDQTYTDFDVLCVNDGSTDGSQKIIDKYVDADKRFKSYYKKNGGLSDARNYGLKRCAGDYIMFIDSDDFTEPTMLKYTYDRACQDNLDLVIFDFYQYYTQNNTKETIVNRFDDGIIYNLQSTPELLCYVNNAAWNKLYRRSLFTDNGITYPFGYRHQDLGTTPKLLYLAKRIGFVRKPLYNYLIDRPDNLTQQYDKKIYHIIDMNREYLEFYRDIGKFNTYYEELKYLCVINMLNSLKKVIRYRDRRFVAQFIDDAFAFMHNYFTDFPKCRYEVYNNRYDRIYLNRTLLKMYLIYYHWKGNRQ